MSRRFWVQLCMLGVAAMPSGPLSADADARHLLRTELGCDVAPQSSAFPSDIYRVRLLITSEGFRTLLGVTAERPFAGQPLGKSVFSRSSDLALFR
jgi:hypothetical protein